MRKTQTDRPKIVRKEGIEVGSGVASITVSGMARFLSSRCSFEQSWWGELTSQKYVHDQEYIKLSYLKIIYKSNAFINLTTYLTMFKYHQNNKKKDLRKEKTTEKTKKKLHRHH